MKKYSYYLNITLLIIYLLFVSINTYSFNMYYPYSHLDLFNPGFIIFEILKISSYLLLPLAIFLNNKTSRNISKFIFPIVAIGSLCFSKTYFDINLNNYEIINSNNLDEVTLEIYRNINNFLPETFINFSFIFINVLLFTISTILLIDDDFKIKDLKSLIYYPFIILLIMPLNIFDTLVRTFNKETYDILKFNNFTIWHLLMFLLLIFITLLTFFILNKANKEKQIFYLRAMAIVLFIHYFSKNSMVIGDGYNVYNLVFSTIPLFICDIGKYIVLLAVFSKKKIFYDIAFFVHSAGALTVFFYFGKEGTHNYGTILNYSFLYFTITHLYLFMLSVLPVMLKHSTFKLKDTIKPSIYYGTVILISTFVSVALTNASSNWVSASGEHLNTLYKPNYAFTQVCPVPVEFPTFLNVKIGEVEINFFYEIVLYLAYIVLFFTFFLFQVLVKHINLKIKLRIAAKSI